jgi:hypothetical protein
MRYSIELGQGFAAISPPPPLEMRDLMQYQSREFTPAGPLGYIETIESYSLEYGDHKDRLMVPTPTMLQIIERLKSTGHEIRCRGLRQTNRRLDINTQILKQTGDEERCISQAVQPSVRGQIEVRGFNELISRMTLIINLYPKANVLIMVPTRTMARNVCWKLRQQLGNQVQLRSPNRTAVVQRCLVTTFGPLNSWMEHHGDEVLGEEDRNWDIILLPDPLRSLGTLPLRVMERFGCFNGRVFSCVSPRIELSQRERILLTAISGPVIYKIPSEQVGTQITWLRSPSAKTKSNLTGLAWKREMYWYNSRRNQFIAAVGNAFARGDMSRLRKYGVPEKENMPLVRGDTTPRVAMLVESSEHGREMAKLLEGWQLIALHDKPDKPKPPNSGDIVTVACAARRGLNPDVIVVASGSPAQLNLERHWPRSSEFDDRDVLIVDFEDGFDDVTREAAILRQRFALRRGWKTADWSPATPNVLAKQ